MTSRHHHPPFPTNVPTATTNYIGRSINNNNTTAPTTTYHPSQEEKIRVLCVGDSGAGKTSLIRRLANGGVPSRATVGGGGWTIGVEVEVIYQHQDHLMVEVWDVGGHEDYADARRVFYNQINAIMLVYDVTNKKSALHLKKWLEEIVQEDREKRRRARIGVEEFLDEPLDVYGGKATTSPIPILIVGNKMDLISSNYSPNVSLMERIASLTGSTKEFPTRRDDVSTALTSIKLPQVPSELSKFNHILTSALSLSHGGGDETFESFFRAALERKRFLKRAGR